MENKMAIIAFSLWSIATVYSSTVIADVWQDYRPLVPALEVEVIEEDKKKEDEWIAVLFNKYYADAWDQLELRRTSRPSFFLTPFITRYHEEVR